MSETRGSIGVLSLFALLAIGGGAFGVAAVKDFADARASVRWNTAEGVILSGATAADPAEIRYAYYYDGQTYEAGRLRFLSARTGVAETVYAAGDQVEVYISPADPARSVLKPGGSGEVFAIALLISGFLLFVGLGGSVKAMASGRNGGAGAHIVTPSGHC